MTPAQTIRQQQQNALRDLIEQDYYNRGKDVFTEETQHRITRDTKRVINNIGLTEGIVLFTDY